MELTYENIVKWFDTYFSDVYKYQGEISTVPYLKKYFTPDFEFCMYTSSAKNPDKPDSRDELLMTFVHPDFKEKIVPRYYVVDLYQLIVVVQFEIVFSDELTGQSWPAIQASAHYHLALDEKNELVIRKINYWTQVPVSDDIFTLWGQRTSKALTEYAMSFIQSKS